MSLAESLGKRKRYCATKGKRVIDNQLVIYYFPEASHQTAGT
ncbi:hypothetical protein MB901379_04668 [Mycobacterium basiliense]|uniref:Uncharacterized protein n=1 Tax=Mycobacterium basiliense TaxID=2094119 RepID=A0A3S4DWR5_9MYCO|nr:hypothetical protein MB901379_04668 [Mycobacterium basiliense]